MKNVRRLSKQIGVLLLAAILALQGLVPVAQPLFPFVLTQAMAEEQSGQNTPALPDALDGSKIEGIDIHWITPDSPVANNGMATPQDVLSSNQELFIATDTVAELSMKYQIEVSFSGQYDYAPGDIQITIPAQVWHPRTYETPAGANADKYGVVDKNGVVNEKVLIGGMDLSVPMAPSTAADFNWQLIDGNYVLINTKTLGATSKAMFQFTINGLKPQDIVDMSFCDPISAHCEVVTNKGNLIALTSNPITAQIDTVAEINACYKEGELYTSVPEEIPQYLLNNLPTGAKAEDYVYVRWYSNKRHTTNQAFRLDIEDTLGNAYKVDANGNKVFVTEGILLGAEKYTGKLTNNTAQPGLVPEAEYKAGNVDYRANLQNYQYTPSSAGSFDTTVVIWSAYQKDAFVPSYGRENEVNYVMENRIDWYLTEADGAITDSVEDQDGDTFTAASKQVTHVTDEAQVAYSPIGWDRPTGHFEVFKWTEQEPKEDHLYGYGLNQLLKGQDVSMRYHLLTRGFGYPWTSVRTNPEDKDYIQENLPTAEEDYGYLGWRQTVEDFDTFFNFDPKPLTSRDFEITYYEVEIPIKYRFEKVDKPTMGYMPAQNTVTASHIVYGTIPAGHYGYLEDPSLPNPDLQIEYQLNNDGKWIHAATATWGETGLGDFQFVDVADGIRCELSTKRVYFPENTTDVRHIFVSNVFGGKTMTHRQCWVDNVKNKDQSTAGSNTCTNCPLPIAAIDWYSYLGIDLKASPEVIAIAESLFEKSDTPSTKFKNDVQMEVDGWVYDVNGKPDEGTRLAHDENSFYDFSRATIAGAGYGATLGKTIQFNPASKEKGGDNDTENRLITLHYKSTLKEESNLRVREEYDTAVAENIVVAETAGIWYDLLPEGVSPLLDTIKASEGETITAVYTKPNFRDTGRTLLVVEMDMTPTVNGGTFYYDSAYITFDATIGWDDIEDLGTNAVNYIAFESRTPNLNDGILGSIDGRQGEPDDPLGGMNDFTPSMPDDIVAALTGLNPNTGSDSRFLYAKVDVNLNVNTAAVSGIAKTVRDDLGNAGWTQGLDGQAQVVVYEGHNYTYRLRVASSESTTTSDMIIYDTIENYHVANDGTKDGDYQHIQDRLNWQGDWQEKGQWRGALVSVDLSDFVAADVAPVLYYSEEADLTFADSTPDMSQAEKLELFNSGAYDISDTKIWHKAELDAAGQWVVPDGLAVTAVAVDARKDVNGNDFILQPGKALTGYMKMIAPDDNSDPDVWHAKGAYAHKTDANGNPLKEIDWVAATDAKNNMYAFNNTRLKCVQSGTEAGGQSSNMMIRNDYTRVGILPGVIGIKKVWDDDENWDGLRPESITVTLMRKTAGKGDDYAVVNGEDGKPLTVTLNEANHWTDYFLQVDLVDEQNNQYLFSFDEEDIEGYTGSVYQLDTNHYQLVNVHEKEQVPVKGAKQWNDNENVAGARPEAIEVKLLQDGVVVKTIVVQPDAEGNWNYDFGLWDTYAQGGVDHVYTVEEEYVAKYVPSSTDYTLLKNDYEPFGDLSVLKTLSNADEISEAAKANQFTFTIELFEEQTAEEKAAGKEPKPLLDSYNYKIMQLDTDGTWKSVSSGTLSCSSSFVLKGDQKILIEDLPSESTYSIIEAETPGFRLTGKVNAEGTIRAGQLTEAEFTNTYSATGVAQLNAGKTLTGHGMKKNQHKFELIDRNVGTNEGQVIRTAYTGTATNVQDKETGVITGTAVAAFGQLAYSQADHGKEFHYQVVEVNTGKPGYDYDDTKVNVTVTVTDNGDGTMTVTAIDDATGKDLTLSDGSGMGFENEYEAHGDISLKAWKVLNRRDLEAGEFEFELYRYNPADGATVGEALATATNDADGNVVFAGKNAAGEVLIPELVFNQDSVSLDEDKPAQYAYLVKEKAGTDNTVIYSNEQYVYLVTVYDNHDGTLSFDEVVTKLGGTAAMPVFTNDLEDGALAIKKTAAKGSNTPFTFKVRLSGEGLPDNLTGKLDGVQVPAQPTPEPEPEEPEPEPEQPEWSKPPVCVPTEAPAIETHDWSYPKGSVYHADETKDLVGQAYAMLDKTSGKLTIFRSNETSPTAPDGKAFYLNGAERVEDTANNRVYFDLNETRTAPPAWSADDRASVITVEVVNPYRPVFVEKYFDSFSELVSADLGLMDTSLCTSFFDMFVLCEKLKRVNVGGFDTSNVTTMRGTFHKCRALETLDLSNWDTSNVTSFYWMFVDCEALKRLDVSTWNTSNVTEMSNMFGNCASIQTLDLTSFDNTKVGNLSYMFSSCDALQEIIFGDKFTCDSATNMNSMFSYCYQLRSVDVSKFKTTNVENMGNMFRSCAELATIDVSNFDTKNCKYMDCMFYDCQSATKLDVSGFNTSKLETINEMFYHCKSVDALAVEDFDVSRVTNFASVFDGCARLDSLNLTKWDVSKAQNFQYLFQDCHSLTNLNVSNWNTSNVTNMGDVFENCYRLTNLDVSNWDTGNVTYMEYMFKHCDSLETLDLSKWNVEKVPSLKETFAYCYNLADLKLTGWKTPALNSMEGTFDHCYSLTSLDLSSFNTSNLTNLFQTFMECKSLKSLDLSNFNTEGIGSYWCAFNGCESLEELNLSGWNTRNGTDFGSMFYRCKELKKITIGSDTVVPEGKGPKAPTDVSPYDGRWRNEVGTSVALTVDELFSTGGKAGTWVWNESTYKIDFLGDLDPATEQNPAGGSMQSATDVWTAGDYTFVPGFYKFGHELSHFADKADPKNDDKWFELNADGTVTIPAGKYNDGDKVTLFAVWTKRDLTVELENGEFTISIYPGETITFKDLPAGTFYEVYEQVPEGWSLVKQENVSGTIKPLEVATASFENSREAKEITVYPKAYKALDYYPAKAGKFEFTLSKLDPDMNQENLVETVKNKDGGLIEFTPITYTLDDLGDSTSKTFTYIIKEVKGSDTSISYDTRQHTAKVELFMDGTTLKANVTYDNNVESVPVFQNNTLPGGFAFEKQIIGDLTYRAQQQLFTFQVTFTDEKNQPWTGDADNDVKVYRNGSTSYGWVDVSEEGVATVTLKGGQSIRFADIPAGVRYEIKETGTLPGWTMDGKVVSGKIVSNESPAYTFTNEYTAEGSVTISALKQLLGRSLKADEFTFQLVEAIPNYTTQSFDYGDVISTATNQVDGTILFEPINYTQEGYYYYFIREVAGTDETIDYTDAELLVYVMVQDMNGTGVLSTQYMFYQNQYWLTNTVFPGSLEISKTVVSSYEPHKDQEFTFTVQLSDPDGNPISGDVSLSDGGKVTFTDGTGTLSLKGGQTVTLTGLYAGSTYTVTEAEVAGFTADITEVSGEIKADETATAAFTNTYAAKGEYTLKVTKELTGLDLTINQFSFQLLDENDYVLETINNDENGKAEFSKMLFTEKDAGTSRIFQVREVASGEAGITYDETIYTVTLTITDNGEGQMIVTDDLEGGVAAFENTYDDKTEFSVSKVWNDGDDLFGQRPAAITVKLLQNRVEYTTVELNADNEWKHTFTELPAFDDKGVPYLYEAEEVPVEGYTSKISQNEDEATITNTVLGALKVSKIVESGNQQQLFDFTVTLADGDQPLTGEYKAVTSAGETTVTLDENGECTFQLKHGESLTMYGLPIGASYSVVEADVPGYTGTVTTGTADGRIQRLSENEVTYTNVGELVDFTVTKVWEGGGGLIELTLYANGVKMDPQPVCTREGDVYTYKFLLKYDELGTAIVYSAKETYFDGFVTIYKNVAPFEGVTDRVHDGGTIINREIKKADFMVRKVWEGFPDDIPTPSIELVLYCNGEALDIPTPPRSSNGWYKYYDLPDHYKGEPAFYYVVEVPLPGYTTSYQLANKEPANYADNGGRIINVKLPVTGDASMLEMWTVLAGASALMLVGLLVVFKWKNARKAK